MSAVPAQELGYIAATTGHALNCPHFMQCYVAAGGGRRAAGGGRRAASRSMLRYCKTCAYAHNDSAADILSARFDSGVIDDLELTVLPHHHFANFIDVAERLIADDAEESAAI